MSVYATIRKQRDGRYIAERKQYLSGGPWGPYASRREATRAVAKLAMEERDRKNAWNRDHPTMVQSMNPDGTPGGLVPRVFLERSPDRSDIVLDAISWPLIEVPGLPVIMTCWIFFVVPVISFITWISLAVGHAATAQRTSSPINMTDVAIIDVLVGSAAFPILWFPVGFLRNRLRRPARAIARGAGRVGGGLLGLIALIIKLAVAALLIATIVYVVYEYRLHHGHH